MSGRTEIGAGVLMGTLVAGPAFTTLIGVATMTQEHGTLDKLAAAIAFGFTIAVPFGAILAVIPVLLGTSLLGWLGSVNEGARLPPFWALIGAAAAGLPAWWLGDADTGAMFAATGAICAVAARWKTRWLEAQT